MFDKCPKCGHVCKPAEPASGAACPACGLIFAKYLQAEQRRRAGATFAAPAPEGRALLERLLYVPARVQGLAFYGRCFAYAFCFVWGWRLYALDVEEAEIMNSFMHLIVLPIHEAGHVLFLPFGSFMSVLGGSLLQILLPLALMVSFVYGFGGSRRDNFAASLMLWWAAMATIDIAPYIWDAWDPKLMLLDGRTGAESDGHDWQNILGDLGLSRRAHGIAGLAHTLGLMLMLAAYAWGAALLYRQRRNLDSDAAGEEG